MALIAAVLTLASCSETQLLLHTAKKMQAEERPGQQGIYKVGNPYAINGVWYYPAEDYSYDETGLASWYGPGFHAKATANGETYDQNALTAAHKTLPMPSLVQVTNLENGRSLRLRINDRGPFVHGRIIDVSRRAAQLLGFHDKGTARVRVQILDSESRILAQQAKQGTVLARAETPIRSDLDVSQPGVAAETLAPPPGARGSAVPASAPVPVRAAPSVERASLTPASASATVDGTVTTVSIGETRLLVQVGAFTEYQNAYQVQARLREVADINVTSAIVNGREFFRVRTNPLGSVEQADRVLESIIDVGYTDARIVVE